MALDRRTLRTTIRIFALLSLTSACGDWPDDAPPDEPVDADAADPGPLVSLDPGRLLAPEGDAARRGSRRPGGLAKDQGGGELVVTRVRCRAPEGDAQPRLPLEHTDVRLRVTGFVARATVTQTFTNPYAEPLEAVYVFPLPDDAAVDAMTMQIGDRRVRAEINRREEARRRYDEARRRGQRAALLEQERANVFTQSVVNIMPGDRIEIEIQYVNLLRYEDGAYELVFPLVVGPRYVPGTPLGQSGHGDAPDTDRVPDGSRVTPPVLSPTERSGHDVTLSVHLDAGVPIQGLYSSSHALSVWELGPGGALVELSPADRLPNKDFVLRYQVAGAAPQVALLPHYDERGGFFALVVQPQRDLAAREITPRELILIADTSGSMAGAPMETSKRAMRRLLAGMRGSDRFNVVRFAGDTATLFAEPQPYSPERLDEALAFVEAMHGAGGTEMAQGIVAALSQPSAPGTLRVAVLLTDGYVDEAEVFDSIQTGRRAARVFTVGIGAAPNRYLLDRAAQLGRGEAFVVGDAGEAREVIDRLYHRVDRPALRNLELDWGGLEVDEVYPSPLPDLFAGQPLVVYGRYRAGGSAEIEVRGELARGRFAQRLALTLPTAPTADSALATVWARQKVKSLMLDRVRLPGRAKALAEAITTVGLEFAMMTEWTSFIAVDEQVANPAGEVCLVAQPVELPEGASYEGIFGPPLGCDGQLGALGGGGFGSGSGYGSGHGGAYGFGYGVAGVGLAGKLGFAGLGHGGGGLASRSALAPSIQMAAPVIRGSLSKEMIQKVIDAHRNQIRYCYELELQRQPTLAGRVLVTLLIDEHGLVTRVSVSESTLANPAVEACILAKIRAWQFPAIPGAGVIEVNYPFVFQPK